MRPWFCLILLFPCGLRAQDFSKPLYPKNYFRDPLGIPMLLAGNYGEIRPGHFHSGIDIKTQERTGLPVFAAAAGYISRVSISNRGYGHALYITHPDGLTTLYGHLSAFAPRLTDYIRRIQYQRQTWSLDLKLPRGSFPVSQGELIARSGNTGDALAPHLHFEIRDTRSQKPLNPLLFGFPVRDHIPPALYRIDVYDRDRSIYEQIPRQYPVQERQGRLTLGVPLIRTRDRLVGFGINTLDLQDGTHNYFGVYEAILFVDGKPDIGFQLDSIGYDETRYVNAHIDYRTWKSGGPLFQLLFRISGNELPIYHDFSGDGSVDLSDETIHRIRIEVLDAYRNTTTLRFDIFRGITTPGPLPKPCRYSMLPHQRNIFDTGGVSFYLSPQDLYSRICFRYRDMPGVHPEIYSDIYRLGSPDIPIHDYFTLHIKPSRNIPTDLRNKVVIVREGLGSSVTPGRWDSRGWVAGNFRNFGDFSIRVDDEPPFIHLLNPRRDGNYSRTRHIVFRIGDNLSGIHSFNGYLDGRWILMGEFRNTIYYTFDKHCPKGSHELRIVLRDKAGNESDYRLHFTR